MASSDDSRVGSPSAGDKLKFDYRNLLVKDFALPDKVEIHFSIPLEDGAQAETRITLGSPTRFKQEDGSFEYKMEVSSNLLVTRFEKATDHLQVWNRDGLYWELPRNYPGSGTALLLHEPKVKEFLTDRFQRDKVFVDVGADVGAYSVRAAASGMKVYAFEPNPGNARILRRNAEINHLTINIIECALGAFNGKANLSQDGAISRITKESGIEVSMRTLDSFELPGADLLKVDVEGYELEVVKGAKQTLTRFHPTLMVEMHHWIGAENEAALFDILSHLNYRFEYLDRYSQGRHLTAEYTP